MNHAISLPADWGCARLLSKGEHFRESKTVSRSYDDAGNQLAWQPPPLLPWQRVACDMEHTGRDCSFLASRLGVAEGEFPVAWVATEVMAKLADIPILQWLSHHGLIRSAGEGIVDLKLPAAPRIRRARLLLIRTECRAMVFGVTL